MLVPPNGITHGPAVNRGLDCTLSQLEHTQKSLELTDALPVVERRRAGVSSGKATLRPLRIGPGSELITVGAGH